MALRLVAPCPLGALRAMTLATGAPASSAKFAGSGVAIAVMLAAKGRSWAAIDEAGAAIAAFGAIWVGDCQEAWFLADRQGAAPRMRGVLQLAQLTLGHVSQDGPVKARVALGWRPGARIARAVGMRRGSDEMGYEVWETGQ